MKRTNGWCSMAWLGSVPPHPISVLPLSRRPDSHYAHVGEYNAVCEGANLLSDEVVDLASLTIEGEWLRHWKCHLLASTTLSAALQRQHPEPLLLCSRLWPAPDPAAPTLCPRPQCGVIPNLGCRPAPLRKEWLPVGLSLHPHTLFQSRCHCCRRGPGHSRIRTLQRQVRSLVRC